MSIALANLYWIKWAILAKLSEKGGHNICKNEYKNYNSYYNLSLLFFNLYEKGLFTSQSRDETLFIVYNFFLHSSIYFYIHLSYPKTNLSILSSFIFYSIYFSILLFLLFFLPSGSLLLSIFIFLILRKKLFVIFLLCIQSSKDIRSCHFLLFHPLYYLPHFLFLKIIFLS